MTTADVSASGVDEAAASSDPEAMRRPFCALDVVVRSDDDALQRQRLARDERKCVRVPVEQVLTG